MGPAVWLTLSLLAACQASPLPKGLKYDQRQEGKFNVRADLENIVILVIPASSSGSSSANASLLDFLLFKSMPMRYYKKLKKQQKSSQPLDGALSESAEQFMESKTAPYHVDISRTRNHLAKLHPDAAVKEEVIIAHSPSVALSKLHDENDDDDDDDDDEEEPSSTRSSRAILLTIPTDNENLLRHKLKDVIGGKAGENVQKTIVLSAEAFEQLQKGSMKESEDTYSSKLEKLAEEIKNNKTVNHVVVLAKTIQAGLVEYFKTVAEKLKEQQEAQLESLEEEADKDFKTYEPKIRKAGAVIKDKKDDKADDLKLYLKLKGKKTIVPKLELEPPMMEAEFAAKVEEQEKPSRHKDELILLGAENEQCGPDRERDPSGICRDAKS